MSFLSGLVGKAVGFLTGDSLGSTIARTVLTGLAVRKLSESSQKDTNAESAANEQPNYGVREQTSADPSTKIPVVYGDAFLGGSLIDARMTNNNQTMWYALAICEVTGTDIAGNPSVFEIEDVYWNNSRVTFKSHSAGTNDAYTVNTLIDRNGKVDSSVKGLIQIYMFNGAENSINQTLNVNNTEQVGIHDSVTHGYEIFPQWTSTDNMTDLIYCLVRVDYNKEKNVSGLADMKFYVKNSLKAPGDVLYDYMTNTRYGAGIAEGDINVQ